MWGAKELDVRIVAKKLKEKLNHSNEAPVRMFRENTNISVVASSTWPG